MKKNDQHAPAEAPGLYVHVPFCRTKCPYCGFYSVTSSGSERRWLDALAREAEHYRGLFAAFDTLYVGGGTPSSLEESGVSRLAGDLRRTFLFTEGAEATIEANPDDVTAARLGLWRDLGFTRLSLGVQSFDDAVLQRLGRRHDARAARCAVELARAAGFDNVGIDLIYGVDGQPPGSWERTIDEAVEHAPEHISCYELTIEPGTEFGAARAAGSLRLPGEGAARRLFLETSARLRSRGYVHYEISNFARGASLASRHNLKYWRGAPYLGLGPAAHSFRGDTRWWNIRSLDAYLAALETARTSVEGSETLDEEKRGLEALSLGFRTSEGVPLAALRRYPRWEDTLDDLVRRSLVSIEDGRAVPTVEGFCVADRLPLLFAA